MVAMPTHSCLNPHVISPTPHHEINRVPPHGRFSDPRGLSLRFPPRISQAPLILLVSPWPPSFPATSTFQLSRKLKACLRPKQGSSPHRMRSPWTKRRTPRVMSIPSSTSPCSATRRLTAKWLSARAVSPTRSQQTACRRASPKFQQCTARPERRRCPRIARRSASRSSNASSLISSKVLEYVELEISTNQACACEIVKSAIAASDADTAEVVAIVETAITVAP